jgi:hypothetical protein
MFVALHTNLDGVVWKLIAKRQAFAQSIYKAMMVRLDPAVDADDEMLFSHMRGDSVFHGIPTEVAAAPERKPSLPAAFPMRSYKIHRPIPPRSERFSGGVAYLSRRQMPDSAAIDERINKQLTIRIGKKFGRTKRRRLSFL